MNQFMGEHMPVAVQSQQKEFTMAVADDTALREELEKLNK